MRCPRCGYRSFPYLDTCKACGADLTEFKVERNIWGIVAGPLNLLYYEVEARVSAEAGEEVVGGREFSVGLQEADAEAEERVPAVEIDDTEGMTLEELATRLREEGTGQYEGEEGDRGGQTFSLDLMEGDGEEGEEGPLDLSALEAGSGEEAVGTEDSALRFGEGSITPEVAQPKALETAELRVPDPAAAPAKKDARGLEEIEIDFQMAEREEHERVGSGPTAYPEGSGGEPVRAGDEPVAPEIPASGPSQGPADSAAKERELERIDLDLDLEVGEPGAPRKELGAEAGHEEPPKPGGARETPLEEFSFDLDALGGTPPEGDREEAPQGEVAAIPSGMSASPPGPTTVPSPEPQRRETAHRGPAIDLSDAGLEEVEVVREEPREQPGPEPDAPRVKRGPSLDLGGIDLEELAGQPAEEIEVVRPGGGSEEEERVASRGLPSVEELDFELTEGVEEAKRYAGPRRSVEDEQQPGFVRPPERAHDPNWHVEGEPSR